MRKVTRLGFCSAVAALVVTAGALPAQSAKAADQGSEHGGRSVGDGGGEHAGSSMGQSDGMMNMSMARHRFVRRNGIPDRYQSMENPLEPTEGNVANGESVYQAQCAACHGESGRGDGPAGENLDPQPTNIARFAEMPMANDAYLYWTIAEGGEPVGSAMPPYEDTLEAEQIWQVILYLRQM